MVYLIRHRCPCSISEEGRKNLAFRVHIFPFGSEIRVEGIEMSLLDDDDDYERYQRDNAELEHFVTTPFRMAMWGCKAFFAVIAVIIMWGTYWFCIYVIKPSVDNVGWMVNRGENSQRYREKLVKNNAFWLRDSLQAPEGRENDPTLSMNAYPVTEFSSTVDFGKRGETSLNDDEGNFLYALRVYPEKDKRSQWEQEDINPCESELRSPWQTDTRPSPWLKRRKTIFLRKSARMRNAYVTGAIMSGALRYTLASLKLHKDPRAIGDFYEEPCLIVPVRPMSMQHVAKQLWIHTNDSIQMNAAPIIRYSYAPMAFNGDPGNEELNKDDDNPRTHTVKWIHGMCLVKECTDSDYEYYVTGKDDLLSKVPPLSPNQEDAVNHLNAMATDDFWLQTARENHIKDDAVVLKMASRARAYLKTRIMVQ
jgi:hypothetical protein